MKQLLKDLSDAYYNGHPQISDEEFDVLAAKYNFDDVGHKITDGIPHLYPMRSLRKIFEGEDTNDIHPEKHWVETPKLDGAAVSLLYVSGELVLALTRGDGRLGRDITDKMKMLAPTYLSSGFDGVTFQINGEVVCPKEIENSRNLAAGSLNLKDLEEFSTRPLTFVAYDILPQVHPSYIKTLEFLEKRGIHTVLGYNIDLDKFPHDGVVYRLDNNELFESLGYTAHHPRGAYALKKQKESVHTTLLDVVWQVGKSGVVSPVAILEPVNIGGAMVSKATLHNIDYIEALDLELGCKVGVIRSGEIIPRIVERIYE